MRCSSAYVLLFTLTQGVVAHNIAKEFRQRPCSDLCNYIVNKDPAAGYKCECHNITSEDGFVLQTARLLARNQNGTKLPVFLMHGFFTSAIDWVSQPKPSYSLPYMLADAGFDVWLGNNRGNVFSASNAKLDINTQEYWDAVDHDEMASKDVPAILDLVLNVTHAPKLHWVGHSQGGGVLVFALAKNPALKDRFATSVLLAPGVHVNHLKVPLLRFLGDAHIDAAWHALDIDIPTIATGKEYFPGPGVSKVIDFFTKDTPLCRISVALCNDIGKILGISVGDPENLDPQTMADAYGFDPAGSSFHLLMHWAQRLRKDTLAEFDWGVKGNLQHYHSLKAPVYDLSKITGMRMGLFDGLRDQFITPPDISKFLAEVPEENIIYHKTFPKYAHFDFVWGKNAHTILYPEVMDLLFQDEIHEMNGPTALPRPVIV